MRSLRRPYRRGKRVHFAEGDDSAPTMWESHPPNRLRELNAKRVYVKDTSHETAVAELKRNAGTQFDPTVVEAFLGGIEDYRVEYGDYHEREDLEPDPLKMR